MLLLLLATLVFVQAAGARVETLHLTAVPSVKAEADGRTTLVLDVTLKPTMHVYAPEETRYQRVTFTLHAPPAVKAAPPVFPKGESFFFAPLGETQTVYSRSFRIMQPIVRQPGAPPTTLTGTLLYQACDDRVCYLPRKITVAWVVE